MSRILGVGIIGLGFMGRTHLTGYRLARDAGIPNRLVAVCDRDPELRAGRLAAPRGNLETGPPAGALFDPDLVRAYERPEDLLSDPAVDVVSVCTYTPTHVPLAAQALQAGKHVLVEKPVALRAEDVRRLQAIATTARRLCMPAMCMRFWPGWVWLKEQITSGTLGGVQAASFQRLGGRPAWGAGFYADDDACGGALFDLHVHDADFVLHCFGTPDAVTTVGTSSHATTVYHFRNGPRQVVAEGGWLPAEAFPFAMRFRAAFDGAVAEFDLARSPRLLLYQGGKSRPVALADGDGYGGEIAHFLQAVHDGAAVPSATLEEAITLTTVLEREQVSLREGRTVAIGCSPSDPAADAV